MKSFHLYHATDCYHPYYDCGPIRMFKDDHLLRLAEIARVKGLGVEFNKSGSQRPGVYFSPSRRFVRPYGPSQAGLLFSVKTNLDPFRGWDFDYELSCLAIARILEECHEEMNTDSCKQTALMKKI